jgi:hypothetical protein
VLTVIFSIKSYCYSKNKATILIGNLSFKRRKLIFPFVKKKRAHDINLFHIIVNALIMALSCFFIYIERSCFTVNGLALIVIIELIIYSFSIFIYGINNKVIKLFNLEIVNMFLREDKNYYIECKILHVKNDFIYYIYNEKVSCVNKSKVLDIKDVETKTDNK